MFAYGGTLRAVHGAPVAGLVAQALILIILAATIGLGGAGWAVGAACALVLSVALARAVAHYGEERLSPASWVTLARATLAVGVAGLTADSLVRASSPAPLVALAAVALALDWVDGQVARRTATESRLGAQLDGEVDAFLILVLSVAVAPSAGVWVLAIGLARYAFLAAGWPLEWMRARLPRRDWRKTVTAVQGILLAIAAADALPRTLMRIALAAALILLAESFGRDVWWLWRRRHAADLSDAALKEREPDPESRRDSDSGSRGRLLRAGFANVLTLLALLIVWFALVAPSQPARLTPGEFMRLPLEGLMIGVLALALPRSAGRFLPWLVGPALGILLLVKLLDMGFFAAFDRPFNPVEDWNYFSFGTETLRQSVGRTRADLVLAGLGLVGVLSLLLPTLAVLRLTRVAARNRRSSTGAVAGLGVTWLVLWVFGAQFVPGAPIASTSAAGLVMYEVHAVQAGLHDHARFAALIRHDPYRSTPGNRLLTALRGKDVLLVFVESYGKFAVQGSSVSPQVDSVLAQGTQQLSAAGFSARSGWMNSATFGGVSWLAHSSMQAGLWVDSNDRYNQLMTSRRFTLSQAFQRAGWRTVDVVPADDRPWPQGSSFYHFDKVYNRLDVGYHGPTYAYASMPDQYLYLSLERLELAKTHRPPIFAEVDTVSSHEPWTQIPPLIPWSEVGDGSIFKRLPFDRSGLGNSEQGYGQSIEYSLRALFSFVQYYGRKNLVMVVLGDHQPAHTVSGFGVDHHVPISIIAHDPAVLRRAAGWGWVAGMRPTTAAPVWQMNSFRDRFLATFGRQPASASGVATASPSP
jgi:phosphatidylglycerophosphate synthase